MKLDKICYKNSFKIHFLKFTCLHICEKLKGQTLIIVQSPHLRKYYTVYVVDKCR